MVQNRNTLIELFIGNISNSILHKVLEKAADTEELSSKYNKELMTSFDIAMKYRVRINPINFPLLSQDSEYIRQKVINRIKSELQIRISKGYKGINTNLVEQFVEDALNQTRIIH